VQFKTIQEARRLYKETKTLELNFKHIAANTFQKFIAEMLIIEPLDRMQLNKLRVFLEDFKTIYDKDLVPPRIRALVISPDSISGVHNPDRLKLASSCEKENIIKKHPAKFIEQIFEHRSSFNSFLKAPNSCPNKDTNENSFISKSFKISQKRYSAAHKPQIEKIVIGELKTIRNASLEQREIHSAKESESHNTSMNGKKESKTHFIASNLKGKVAILKGGLRPTVNKNEDRDVKPERILPDLFLQKKNRIYSVKPPKTFFMSKPLVWVSVNLMKIAFKKVQKCLPKHAESTFK